MPRPSDGYCNGIKRLLLLLSGVEIIRCCSHNAVHVTALRGLHVPREIRTTKHQCGTSIRAQRWFNPQLPLPKYFVCHILCFESPCRWEQTSLLQGRRQIRQLERAPPWDFPRIRANRSITEVEIKVSLAIGCAANLYVSNSSLPRYSVIVGVGRPFLAAFAMLILVTLRYRTLHYLVIFLYDCAMQAYSMLLS